MSTTYPSSKQSFTILNAGDTLAVSNHTANHNTLGDTLEAIQDVIGTNSGTNILKNFVAGNFPARIDSAGTLQQVLQGTINNSVIGTPAISGGTLNNAVVGTPNINGGTMNNGVFGTPQLTIGSDATGDLFYRGTAGKVSRLAVGTAGQYLTTNGTVPSWGTVATGNDGWIAGTGTWSYSTADAPSFTISVNADLTGVIGVGDRIKLTQTTVKYFIVTAISYSAPNTTITVYGGTDYTLVSESITSPYYSHQKTPLGFPLNVTKWTVEVKHTSDASQSSPLVATWYNLGTISISVPIGHWRVMYELTLYYENNAEVNIDPFVTLSTANNSQSDADLTAYARLIDVVGGSGDRRINAPIHKEKYLSVASKTPYYLNAQVGNASGATRVLSFTGTTQPTIIRAICAYL